MYIGDYLGRREIYSPDKLAIIDAGKTPALRLTYREFNDRANRFAAWLQTTAGVEKGDRVAILARDGVEHLDSFFACGKLGAIHTALNWRLHWRELLGLIEMTQPKVLIYSDDFAESVASIAEATQGHPTPSRTICTSKATASPAVCILSRRSRPARRRRSCVSRWRKRMSPACSLPAGRPACPKVR
jgi:acyl-CoA synthetase (AMP-forming)/AMP-acid ligase II